MSTNGGRKQKDPEINTLRCEPMDPRNSGNRIQNKPSGLSPADLVQRYNEKQAFLYWEFIQEMQSVTGCGMINTNPLGLGYEDSTIVPSNEVTIEGMPPGRPNVRQESNITKSSLTYGEHRRLQQIANDPNGLESAVEYQSATNRQPQFNDPRHMSKHVSIDDGWGDEETPASTSGDVKRLSKTSKNDDWDDVKTSDKPVISFVSKVNNCDDDDEWDRTAPARTSAFSSTLLRSKGGFGHTTREATFGSQNSREGTFSNSYRGGNQRGRGSGSRDGSRDRSSSDRSNRDNRDSAGSRYPPREGSWDCTKCKNSNFKFRTECYRCQEPKGDAVSSSTNSRQSKDYSSSYQKGGGYRGTRGGSRGGRGNNDYSRNGSSNKKIDFKPVKSGWSDDEEETTGKVSLKTSLDDDDGWMDSTKTPVVKQEIANSDDDWDAAPAKPFKSSKIVDSGDLKPKLEVVDTASSRTDVDFKPFSKSNAYDEDWGEVKPKLKTENVTHSEADRDQPNESEIGKSKDEYSDRIAKRKESLPDEWYDDSKPVVKKLKISTNGELSDEIEPETEKPPDARRVSETTKKPIAALKDNDDWD